MRRVFLILFLGVCAGLGGASLSLLSGQFFPALWAQPNPVAGDLDRLGTRFTWVARKLAPAVVAVEAQKPAPPGKTRPVEESGSGVLVHLGGRSDLFVLTNNHVVDRASPSRITINLADGRIIQPARVWTDPESDVAVLKVTQEGLPPAELGDSDRVEVGQWVLAFGSPFGLHQSVTHGIVSARSRGQVSLGSEIRIKDFLQTDAAINPGSSGGPLVDLHGKVIGINTAIASPSGSSSGVAFSIPINLVKTVANQLLTRGEVTRGYLGLQVAALFEPADALRLGLRRTQGALVEKVYTETPAAAAGLQANDVILTLDGKPVRNENQFINDISTLSPGQRIRLQVWRGRRTITVDAVVGDWQEGQTRFGLRR
jgi:serine protease Do